MVSVSDSYVFSCASQSGKLKASFPRVPCSLDSGFKLTSTTRCTNTVSGGGSEGDHLHAVLGLETSTILGVDVSAVLTPCLVASSLGVVAQRWGGSASHILNLESWQCALDFSDSVC